MPNDRATRVPSISLNKIESFVDATKKIQSAKASNDLLVNLVEQTWSKEEN